MAKKDADEAFEEARELIVHEARPVAESVETGLNDYVQRGGFNAVDTTVDAYKAIIDRIMGATSIEEVLNPPQPSNLDDFKDREVIISGFRMLESDFEAGANWYAVMDCMDVDTAEEFVLTTGQQGVMAQLMAVHSLKGFPIRVKVTPSRKPNKYGRFMYRLIGKSINGG